MFKFSVISYKSTILRVHRSVFFVSLRFPDQHIRGVTAPGMNPLPIYIPFLTEKVSFFVHFPFKMVSLKKSLFFASRVKCTVPPFFLFLNSMNRKKKQKKRYFLCILYFNPSFWVLFSTFHLYF